QAMCERCADRVRGIHRQGVSRWLYRTHLGKSDADHTAARPPPRRARARLDRGRVDRYSPHASVVAPHRAALAPSKACVARRATAAGIAHLDHTPGVAAAQSAAPTATGHPRAPSLLRRRPRMRHPGMLALVLIVATRGRLGYHDDPERAWGAL